MNLQRNFFCLAACGYALLSHCATGNQALRTNAFGQDIAPNAQLFTLTPLSSPAHHEVDSSENVQAKQTLEQLRQQLTEQVARADTNFSLNCALDVRLRPAGTVCP
jgi:hypothetical protein